MVEGELLFQRYQLGRQIGAGGMGVVWSATDLLLDQPVAVKHISISSAHSGTAELARSRALREARTAARLRQHPHVVAIYDVQVSGGDVWLILEYLPSVSLDALRRERGRLELAEVARIGAGVADALAAGHSRGIVHRDVTPGNVLVADDGTVKLTDFGISHLLGEQQITQDNVVSGTIAYLAPEVARTGESSPASDVFSLGSTLYALIEGAPPFGTDANSVRLLNVVRTGIIRLPTSAGALTSLLLRLLELDPATRPDAATAAELLDQFAHRTTIATERLVAEPSSPDLQVDPVAPAPPPSTGAAPRRTRWAPLRERARRHRTLDIGLSLAAVAVVVVALVVAVPLLRDTGRGDLVGAPPLPDTVGPVALTGDPKAADPCPLIDLNSLRQFGAPWLAGAELPNECAATIHTPNNHTGHLQVYFQSASKSPVAGQAQNLGGLTIVRQNLTRGDWTPACQNVLILTDSTRIVIAATGSAGFDKCTLAEVGTAEAVNALARNGITYRPTRSAGWKIANANACNMLTDTEISTADADPSLRTPGFANWSCTWGNSNDHVSLTFRIDAAVLASYGTPSTIAAHRAELHLVTDTATHHCDAMIVTRPAATPTDNTEMVLIAVQEQQPDQVLCERASALAAATMSRVPTT
jgi:eukaryotic-like serine/threonine-protein kinase